MVIRKKRQKYLKSITNSNLHLNNLFDQLDVSKLSLALLYLTEGSKLVKVL